MPQRVVVFFPLSERFRSLTVTYKSNYIKETLGVGDSSQHNRSCTCPAATKMVCWYAGCHSFLPQQVSFRWLHLHKEPPPSTPTPKTSDLSSERHEFSYNFPRTSPSTAKMILTKSNQSHKLRSLQVFFFFFFLVPSGIYIFIYHTNSEVTGV